MLELSSGMGKSLGRNQYRGVVDGFSGSGNPVVRKEGWEKRAVIVTDDSEDITVGDEITFTVQADHSDHYQATPVGEGKANVSKPNYSSSPNIPIHHDGKHGESVGETRDKRETYKSPDEREFNPKTYGAPKLSKDKPKRKFLRQD